MAPATLKCVEFRSIESGALLGYADFEFIEPGFTVGEFSVSHSADGCWVVPSSCPAFDRDKNVLSGKTEYGKDLNLSSYECRVAFNQAAITALNNFLDGNNRVTPNEVGQ